MDEKKKIETEALTQVSGGRDVWRLLRSENGMDLIECGYCHTNSMFLPKQSELWHQAARRSR